MGKSWFDMFIVGLIVAWVWYDGMDGLASLLPPLIIGTALYVTYFMAKGFERADRESRRVDG